MRLIFKTSQSEKAVFSFNCHLAVTAQEKEVLNHYRLLNRPVIEGADHSPIARFYIATFRPLFKAIKLNAIFDALLMNIKILPLQRFTSPKGWDFSHNDIDTVLKKMEEIKGSIQNIANATNTMLTFGREEQINGMDYIDFPLAIPEMEEIEEISHEEGALPLGT